MTDPVVDPIVEPTHVVVAPEPVVEPVIAPATVAMTDDEVATQQAAGGAPGTYEGVGEPVSRDDQMTAELKGWIRANARWLLNELDWTRAGRDPEERETLNP